MAMPSTSFLQDDEFNRQSQAFLSWANRRGIVLSPKIKLSDSRHMLLGRAVYATSNIEEDEDLFTIPRSTILTPQTSTLPAHIASELDDPWLSLILVLIYESQQSSSLWRPYLDVLPTDFDTLMYWEDSELSMLQGSAVVDKVGKEKANETFAAQVIPVIRRHAETFNTTTLSDTDLLALCHRMGSTIMAYAFDLERPIKDGNVDPSSTEDGWEVASDEGVPLPVGMVPMADMLNANGDLNNAKLFYEEDKVVMRSIQQIGIGEEILNDYGPNPTGDLLRRYGYTSSRYAKYDVVEIGKSLLLSVAGDILKLPESELLNRLEYLEADISVDDFDIARTAAEDGQFPMELIGVLRCLAMDKADFDKMRHKGKLPSEKALSRDEQILLQMLQAIILKRRQDYTSEPAQRAEVQLEALQDRRMRRRYMAQEVISGEKAVLEEAFSTVASMLSASDNKRKAVDQQAEALPQHDKRQRI